MTTKEFMKLMNFQNIGYEVEADDICVNLNGTTLAMVNINTNDFNITMITDEGVSLEDFDLEERAELARLVIDYATTPIDQRGKFEE